MENIFFGGVQKAADDIIEKLERIPQRNLNMKVHNKKEQTKSQKYAKFSFRPEFSMEQSLDKLQEYCNVCNKRIIKFKGFKGNFKIENWMNVETKLRNINGLKSIAFIDTQLDKEHLDVLSKWLSWIEPQKLIIELQQNELDNEDLCDFLYFLFERRIDIRYIYIIGNPGIYKGVFLKEFQQFLIRNFATNQFHYYKLIKNKKALSIAIVQIQRSKNDEQIKKKIEKAIQKIDQTQYYKLDLKNCFTEKNWQGFQDLIIKTYREDNLESLSYLDISDNFLGTQNAFNNMCTLMSSAKGLLVLKIANQPLIHNSNTIELLQGNRYDNLKLKEIDISNNSSMTEKAFQLLSDNIFQYCNKIDINDCLIEQYSTMLKFFFMVESFLKKTKQKKQLFQQKKIIKYDLLKVLDLRTVENYNRYDQIESLLMNTVFTEFSSIKTLYFQDLDPGRCEAYIRAKQKFIKQTLQLKKEGSIFSEYKNSLNKLVFSKQQYRNDTNIMTDFFLEYFFTEKDTIIEIEFFEIQTGTLSNISRAKGLELACQEIIKKTKTNPNLKYSIKKVLMNEADFQMNFDTLKCFLYLPSVQLEEFIFQNDLMYFQWDLWYKESTIFFSNLQEGQYHSLKTLKLFNVDDIIIEINQFLEMFIFNSKINLKELELIKIITKNTQQSNKNLISIIEKTNNTCLEKLSFGQFQGEGEDIIFQVVVFNQKIKLKYLQLNNIKIQNYLDSIDKLVQSNADQNPLQFIHTIEFIKISIDTVEDWKRVLRIFFINQRLSLKVLYFKDTILNKWYSEAIKILLQPYEQEIFIAIQQKQEVGQIDKDIDNQKKDSEIQNQNIILPFSLQELHFEQCHIQDDVLKGFLVICELNCLSFINCQELDYGLKKTIDLIKIQQLELYYSYKIKSFNCKSSVITDIAIFKFLINGIVLNKNRQMLQILNLESCNLNDDMMQILSQQFSEIKEEQKFYNRVFILRDIYLSNNNQISLNVWKQFWDVLLNEQANKKKEMNEDQSINIAVEQDLINQLTQDEEIIKNQTQKLIETSQLCLKEKILYNFKKFTPQFPKQITSLKLKMNFSNIDDSAQQFQYYRIIAGFIIHPDSQLKYLELDFLNMIVFIKACLEAFEFSKLFFEYALKISKQNHKSQIKQIKLTNLQTNNLESTESFVQMFICSKYIDLTKLFISGCKQPLIHLILKNINRREDYLLEELILEDQDEILDQNDTINYIQWLIFGQKMPIKKLYSSVDLSDLNLETFEQSILQQSKLESIIISYKKSHNYKIYSIILSKLLSSNLFELTINLTDGTTILEESLNKIDDFSKINLKILKFKGDLKINKKLLQIILNMLNKLEFLQINQILLEEEVEIYELLEEIELKLNNNVKFDIKSIIGIDTRYLFERFFLNPKIGIREIILRDPQLFCYLRTSNIEQKLRYLNLTTDQEDYTEKRLNTEGLYVIGQMLIYNEQSVLEELVLNSCHLHMKCIDALCYDAYAFQEKIKKEGRQKTAQLTIKRVTIYNSQFMEDDGINTLNKNLLYFEYINMERFEVQLTNWNNANTKSLCQAAQKWLQFQKEYQRQFQLQYPLKYLDLGRNEFVDEQEVWNNFLQTFVFTDNTPNLETLNIHFMGFNDLKVQYLISEALQFFSKKPQNYKFNVKKINFSHNNSLTHVGWQNIFKNFFFHPKVELIELNMTSTMLDSQIKLNVISDVIKERAQNYPNKKVPLHTLLCYNVSLKDYVADYLSEQPINYQIPQDLPVEIEYNNSTNVGYFDGEPESFGDKLQLFQRLIKYRQKIVFLKDWTILRSKFSTYHLNICDHYLKIFNQYLKQKGNDQMDIILSLKSLDNFANHFEYITQYPGQPYPYNLIFQQQTFEYFKQKECKIFKIKIIQTEFAELEQINQFQILKLWHNIKNTNTSIDQIQIEYDLNDDLIDEMFKQGNNERDIISLIRLIPPSKIRIDKSLSLQAIKAIYSILYDTYYFKYSIISYSFDNFLNVGIGYSLREVFYNYHTTGPIGKFIKKLFYKFFDFFVKPTKKYLFNDEVKQLNNYLSKQKLYFLIIVITNILYFLITLAGPYLFTYKFLEKDSTQLTKQYLCINGTSKEASYLYYAFAALTLLTEAILYYKIAQLVPNHAERIIVNKIVCDEQQEDQDQQKHLGQESEKLNNKVFPSSEEDAIILTSKHQNQSNSLFKKMTTVVNKKIQSLTAQAQEFTQSKWGILFSYSLTLLSSQLFKFDLYNDVVFILNAYHCEEFIIYVLALISTAFSQGIYLSQFIYLISQRVIYDDKTAKLLSSKYINDFYQLSFLGRNAALSTILDSTAPFNVTIIPNTKIGRYFFPYHAGKAMSNLVKAYFFQFIFEDLPQTLLQMLFIVNLTIKRSGQLSPQVYISILTAIFTALSSFYKFLSIRPTNLLQEDFDTLALKQNANYNLQTKQCLQEEQSQISNYISLFKNPNHELIQIEQSEEERQTLLN